MSSPHTAPGTYFETNDFSDYNPALATTSLGLVGTATKGPIGVAVFCSSVEDYIQRFGEPNSYGAHAAVNYLRQGNRCYFIRVARTFDKSSSLVPTSSLTNAELLINPAGNDNSVLYTAATAGVAGNLITIGYAAPAAQDSIVMTVLGTSILVTPSNRGQLTLTGALTFDGSDPVVITDNILSNSVNDPTRWLSSNWDTFNGTSASVSWNAIWSRWELHVKKDSGEIYEWVTNNGSTADPSTGQTWTPSDLNTGTPTLTKSASTAAQVIEAFNADPASTSLASAAASGAVTGAVALVAPALMTGGLGDSSASTQFTAGAGHGIAINDYVEIAELGKKTHRSKVTNVVGNVITLETAYTDAYTSAASVTYAEAVVGAGAGETFLVSRVGGSVSNIVHVKAKDPGTWSNFSTQSGIEIKLEDGGNFANLDPVTGDPVLTDSGYPLQGVGTSRPAVDNLTDLYALTVSDVRVGAMVGVNALRSVFSVTAVGPGGVADTMNITIPGTTAENHFTAGHTVHLRGTGFDGQVVVSSVMIVGGNTVVVVPKTTEPVGITAVVGTLENISTPVSQALVFRCHSANSVSSTWSPIGVLTKKLSVYYKGRRVEIFENLVGYDASLPNYWDTAVQSDYITVNYLGNGQQPINSLSTANPNNVRYLMGLTMSVRQSNSSNAAFTNVYVAPGINGTAPGDAEYFAGLQPIRRKETYAIDLISVPGISSATVINEMMAIAEYRDDSLALVDPPFGLSRQEVVDWHNGQGAYSGVHDAFTGSYGALFYPWTRQYDPYNRVDIWLPPSVLVAPQIAYSDSKGETWFAPAGITRGTLQSAQAVEIQLEDEDVEMMYGPGNGNAINPIRQYELDGIVIMGQRTLQRFPSSLDRINVRRLLSHIIKTLRSGVRRLNFEPNDDILWSQARGITTPIMTNLKGRRAVEWFSVVCDETNNTPTRRNQNQARVDIQLIPTKSAEVLTVGLNLFPSGVTVEQITSTIASL